MNPVENSMPSQYKVLSKDDLFIDTENPGEKTLVRHVENLRKKVTDLALIYDENFLHQKAVKWGDERKFKALRRYKLIRKIFTDVINSDNVITNIDPVAKALKDCKERNINAIFFHTKPFERAARALDLMHVNRDGKGRIILFPVSEERFVRSGNNFHLSRFLKESLEKEFFKFQMKKSPLYITYLGEISDQVVIRSLAEIANKTLALALANVPSHKTIEDFLEFIEEEFKITGIEEFLGHLVLPSSHVKIPGVFDYDIEENNGVFLQKGKKEMAIPSAPIITGALLAADPGEVITGAGRRGIKGTSGPIMQYNKERMNASELAQKGFIMIGENGKIYGARTVNESDKRELHHFPKVDIRNTIGKALIQFSNDESFGKWGGKEKTEFISKVRDYLNEKVKNEVIKSYELDQTKVIYNNKTNRVEIMIKIFYNEITEGFDFSLIGSPGAIDLL